MSYKSPIDLIMSEMQSEIENETYKAVQRVGIYVDKEELIKALAHDRGQYQKGYSDRDSEIVRCKDCRYGKHIVSTVNGEVTMYMVFCAKPYIERGNATHEPDWYCADGKKR